MNCDQCCYLELVVVSISDNIYTLDTVKCTKWVRTQRDYGNASKSR